MTASMLIRDTPERMLLYPSTAEATRPALLRFKLKTTIVDPGWYIPAS